MTAELEGHRPWHDAAQLGLLVRYELLRVEVEGRRVLLAWWRGRAFALDNHCYHSGGPLDGGEIEEIEELGRRPCVVCPWHHYKIMLDSGEGVYLQVDPFAPRGTPPTLRSRGVRQRVHHVRVQDGVVQVRLAMDGPELPCDYYSSDAYRRLMAGRPGASPGAAASAPAPAGGGGPEAVL